MRKPMLAQIWFPVGTLLFGAWCFGLFPLKPPRWLTEGPAVDPMISYPHVARIIYLTLLTSVSVGPMIWVDTFRLRRRLSPGDLFAVGSLVLSSRKGAKTFLVILLGIGLTVWFVLQGMPPSSYLVRIAGVAAAGVLMIVLLPPSAVVLANSSRQSGRLLELVSERLFPYRVVSLLDGAYLGSTLFADRNNNLRTIGGNSWRAAVHRLVEITPLVIVDARLMSPPVGEEIAHMLDPARLGKAVFVINEDGTAPALQAVWPDWRRYSVTCCTVHDLPQIMDFFRKTGRVKPTGGDGGPPRG